MNADLDATSAAPAITRATAWERAVMVNLGELMLRDGLLRNGRREYRNDKAHKPLGTSHARRTRYSTTSLHTREWWSQVAPLAVGSTYLCHAGNSLQMRAGGARYNRPTVINENFCWEFKILKYPAAERWVGH